MTGEPLWRSDKVRGAVMHTALDLNAKPDCKSGIREFESHRALQVLFNYTA